MSRKAVLAVAFVLALGIGVRLYRLTAPPLDFHPTRQMHSALIARQLYLRWRPGFVTPLEREQRELGNRMARYEPPIFEALVARTCLVDRHWGFHLWVARLYDLLFWLLGAWGLFLLARRAAGETAAVLSLGYWMLLPFAVQASRSFQPDPLMTVLLVWAAYFAYEWADIAADETLPKQRLYGALAVVFGAAAGIVKAYAVLFALGIWAGMAVWRYRGRVWRSVWAWLGALGVALPVAAVYFFMPRNAVNSGFIHTWVLGAVRHWLSPLVYGGWLNQASMAFGGGWLLFAVVGVALSKPRLRALALGWLAAYIAYGLAVPVHIATHSYYQLPLLPLTALGVGAGAAALEEPIRRQRKIWQAAVVAALVVSALYSTGITAWEIRNAHTEQKAQMLQTLGKRLPEGKIIALTEAYGYPLMYYANRNVDFWPTSRYMEFFSQGQAAFADLFKRKTRGHHYFLITDMEEFYRQNALRRYLYAHYPVVMEGDGYILFDLSRGK